MISANVDSCCRFTSCTVLNTDRGFVVSYDWKHFSSQSVREVHSLGGAHLGFKSMSRQWRSRISLNYEFWGLIHAQNVRTNPDRTIKDNAPTLSAERTLIASHGKNPIFQSLKTGLNLTGRTIIFTNKVSDLAAFLNHQVRTLDEVLKYLVDQVLVEIEVSSAFVCALNRHNRVDLI